MNRRDVITGAAALVAVAVLPAVFPKKQMAQDPRNWWDEAEDQAFDRVWAQKGRK